VLTAPVAAWPVLAAVTGLLPVPPIPVDGLANRYYRPILRNECIDYPNKTRNRCLAAKYCLDMVITEISPLFFVTSYFPDLRSPI
jgi:hypothetical protein